MNPKLGERIKKKIRRRAFEQSDRLQQERQNLRGVRHTLDALHEVTGLPRPENHQAMSPHRRNVMNVIRPSGGYQPVSITIRSLAHARTVITVLRRSASPVGISLLACSVMNVIRRISGFRLISGIHHRHIRETTAAIFPVPPVIKPTAR